MSQTPADRIVQIDKAILRGKRPRIIGHNARIPTHGSSITDPVVRLHTDSGATGLGWANLNRQQAEGLVGRRIDEVFQLPNGSHEEGLPIDLPLWDLVARLMDLPLYRLLGARGSRQVELYDGSIYIDDLEADDSRAMEIFQQEVATGQEHGYKNFKIKVGRGARWMPAAEGLHRDALVIRTVRQAAGPEAKILIDANMGNTLNSALSLLDLCADVGIYWFEEPFAEDRPLNEALKEYIEEQNLDTLVADGEFHPPPNFFEMVREGLIDIVQHDFRFKGLTWWRATSGHIEEWGARCAPHCWGSYIERFAHAHFAASIPHYALLEAAPAEFPGLRLDGWETVDGCLQVPDTPGAGFDIEPGIFQLGLEDSAGFSVSA
ncbi:MAG: mandelate racemase [Candidatus Latescibacteria bacterium]|nr:mandelate racemase [Candidatus Latescibacterota bacterium]